MTSQLFAQFDHEFPEGFDDKDPHTQYIYLNDWYSRLCGQNQDEKGRFVPGNGTFNKEAFFLIYAIIFVSKLADAPDAVLDAWIEIYNDYCGQNQKVRREFIPDTYLGAHIFLDSFVEALL